MGAGLCAVSAVGFSAMTIFGKLAYSAEVNVPTLLSLRFAIAASVLWLIVGWRRSQAPAQPTPPQARRLFLSGLVLGAGLYAIQSATLFAALTRLDASIAVLLLYAYPSFVTVAAAALGRDFIDRRRAVALLLSTAGVTLVLVSGGGGTIDALGAVMALAAAGGYAAYILVGETMLRRADPLWLSAVVCSGAAASFSFYGLITGEIVVSDAEGWLWIAAIAFFSTVVAVWTLYAGLKRIGPTAASIISTIEPVCAVALAYVIFGESLAALQLLGAATVIGALVVLQATKQASRHPGVAPGERATAGSLVGHTGFQWSHPPAQPPPDRKL